jgi:hypothetical protein
MSNTMRSQLEKAGYRNSTEAWPSDELIEVAVRAMVRHADDTEAAQYAIMRACRNDAALLRQLILPWWRQATASLISATRSDLRQKTRAGALETAQERRAAKVISLVEERELAKEKREHEAMLAEQAAINARHHQEFLDRIEAWRKTKAASFEIDGRPWWEVPTFEARQWQIRHATQARFVDLLLSGVPEDDRPIGYYRRPEEIDALWDKATKAR